MACCIGAVVATGCASESSTVEPTTPTLPTPAPSVTVQALDNSFRAQDLTVVAGTEVIWENVGRNDHNVIPVGDLEATAWGVLTADFAPKATYAHVFTEPGTYAYYCTIHGTDTAGMIGSITVTAP
jgi:plastocyanin